MWRTEDKGRMVLSVDDEGELHGWNIVGSFDDHGVDYFILESIGKYGRKCCVQAYTTRVYDGIADLINNFPCNCDGFATIETLENVFHYNREPAEGEQGYGWLSPFGRFFSCDMGRHVLLAGVVLDKSEVALESEGWIKVLWEEVLNAGNATPEQIRWMQLHGIDESEWS